jgi:hypothetical protein
MVKILTQRGKEKNECEFSFFLSLFYQGFLSFNEKNWMLLGSRYLNVKENSSLR